MASLETQLGDTTGAVERTYAAGKTWRDTIKEMKDGALAYIGPAGDMVGGIGSAASGLALAGPQMLNWIRGINLAAIAQKALNLVMRLNPIGLIVTAIGLVGLAIYNWRDKIFAFIRSAWEPFVAGLRNGYNSIARWVPGLKEVAVTATTDFTPAVETATAAAETMAETVGGSGGGKGGPSLITAMKEAQVAAEDTKEEVELLTNAGGPFTATFRLASQTVDRFGNSLQSVNSSMGVTNQLLPTVQQDIMAAATAMPAAIESADSSFVASGKNMASSFSDSFSARLSRTFESGGSFTDALKSQLVDVGQNVQGFLGNALSGALNMVPVVGPLLAQFAPALMAGISKLAGKVWGGIKSLFGGPDGIEMEGREAAADARDAIADTLTDGQISEAAGDMADAVHIAVRDATLGAGGTIDMAESTATQMVTMLHSAEKEGVGAVAAAQKAIHGDTRRGPERNNHDHHHGASRRV